MVRESHDHITFDFEQNYTGASFQTLESKFAHWEGIQNFIGNDLPGFFAEVKFIVERLPVPHSIIETHLRKL
jgi:hypothetical protein